MTSLPCPAHYSKNRENMITTDACNTGLGATLWHKQIFGTLKAIAFAIRYLNDAQKRYAISELESLGVIWTLKQFTYYIYGKPVKLYTDHQSLQPLFRKSKINFTAHDLHIGYIDCTLMWKESTTYFR